MSNFYSYLYGSIFALVVMALPVLAQPTGINLVPFSTGYSRPLSIENCGDERLFIVQQRGLIIICDLQGNKLPTPFLDLTGVVNQTGNECGLLGLAFHPNYAANGYFYVNYTAGSSCGTSYVARYSRSAGNPNLADPASAVILFTLTQPYSNHNGGNMEFGPDGYLYIGFGDGGSGGDPENYGQNTASRLGKILRIDVNSGSPYGIPPTNPFVGNPAYAPEIWAVGVRNPWRFSFDRANGNMWMGDVGQGGWEEINFEPAGAGGRNYGWKCYEGNATYSAGACNGSITYTFPVFVYPSDDENNNGCSVTGGFVYRGVQFGNMHGAYLFADYCSGKFWTTNADAAGAPPFTFTQILDGNNFQFGGFGEDVYGELYVAATVSSGVIYRIESTNCAPLARITNPTPPATLCQGDVYTLQALTGQGFSYQWRLNGLDILGATNATYNATQNGAYSVRVIKTPSCTATSAVSNLVFKTTPNPVIIGETDVCDDGTTQYTYSVQNSPGYQYNWSITSGNGAIVSGQGTAAITVVWNSGTEGIVAVEVINP